MVAEMKNDLETVIAAFDQVGEFVTSIVQGVEKVQKALPEIVKETMVLLDRLPELQQECLNKASGFGWYPNWYTPAFSGVAAANSSEDVLNVFMQAHLNNHRDDIISEVLRLCPDRADVLNEAFMLHNEERYIASIPLLLSQTEGIFAQEMKSMLFSEHDQRKKNIEQTLEGNEDGFLGSFLAVLKEKNKFSKGISRTSVNHKKQAPNRNGILHGSRKHLDYGTEINSLKCFSLLAFVVFVLVDPETKVA